MRPRVYLGNGVNPLSAWTRWDPGCSAHCSRYSSLRQAWENRFACFRDAAPRRPLPLGLRQPPRVPDDLPEVAIRVAEVSGVDTPRTIVRALGEGCPRLFRTREQCIDLLPGGDEVTEAELARRR